ncbi:MAG: ArsR family transcriptional regulator [Methanotrichaceae archaeon]|nr:ArsR family transcriptional regulator [Methanotrichaceae archaeon]
MRDVAIEVVGERDMEFVETLRSIGAHRNVAKIITYLKDVESASSRDIERATDLRQPEVSIAMRTLRENGWIEEADVKGNGKGRPLKIYSLRVGMDEIIRFYEGEKSREASRAMGAIQRLKELSSV